jgi:hypothetical protein
LVEKIMRGQKDAFARRKRLSILVNIRLHVNIVDSSVYKGYYYLR